jgi:hypothetical protein
MHAAIEEEAVVDKENTDDGENIFVQKMKGGIVRRRREEWSTGTGCFWTARALLTNSLILQCSQTSER